jgi:hypothetical protein
MRSWLLVLLGLTACGPLQPVILDAGPGPDDAGVAEGDGGPSDAGTTDAGSPDAGVPADAGGLELVICSGAPAHVELTEAGPDTTHFQRCASRCTDWRQCTRETTARGVAQLELDYVVDEDGQGRGFGGTLRFTRTGSRRRVVMFHKGGSGTDWVEDFLPGRVEAAGGIAVQPKWVQAGTGWFARPASGSRLERSLFGVSQRVAAVMRWVGANVAQGERFATVGCSGGSIATYYPRHWHGLDPLLSYQLLAGGPVMSKIEWACRGSAPTFGRCTLAPERACQRAQDCAAGGGGTCSPWEWGPGVIMSAVRVSMDHLHAVETNGARDCLLKRPQPAFAVSDFDDPRRPVDSQNEHPIDFMMNVGGSAQSDDDLAVLASGAAVFSGLLGPRTWSVEAGTHCDALLTEGAWQKLRVGAGLP